MKKITFFAIFLMMLSALCLPKANVLAEEYVFKIVTESTFIAESSSLNANPEAEVPYYYCANYTDNQVIELKATLNFGETDLTPYTNIYWIDKSDNSPVSTTDTLKLFRDDYTPTEESPNENLIYYGYKIFKKSYTIYIQNENYSSSFDFDVTILPNNEQSFNLTITTPETFNNLPTNDDGLHILKSTSDAFDFTASYQGVNVPNRYSWYIKTANSNSYVLFYSKTQNCSISPKALVNNTNGFGEYKIYATYTADNQTHYSPVLTFVVQSGTINTILNFYSISKDVRPNSKAQVEAFFLKLENAGRDVLDYEKIIWEIDGQKVGKGESYLFEPLSSKTSNIKVYYDAGNLITLAELNDITPASTGTFAVIIIVAGVIFVLCLIFTISMKIQNKKRDIAW